MTTKNTPGPWRTNTGGEDVVFDDGISGPRLMASVFGPDESRAANSALMAAAPELLDGCKMAMAEAVTLQARLTEPYASNMAKLASVLASAIAKAVRS